MTSCCILRLDMTPSCVLYEWLCGAMTAARVKPPPGRARAEPRRQVTGPDRVNRTGTSEDRLPGPPIRPTRPHTPTPKRPKPRNSHPAPHTSAAQANAAHAPTPRAPCPARAPEPGSPTAASRVRDGHDRLRGRERRAAQSAGREQGISGPPGSWRSPAIAPRTGGQARRSRLANVRGRRR
jgi:hypothetical protein